VSGRFVVVQNYNPSFFFYLLAREFGWTEQEIAEAHVPFVMSLLDCLEQDYDMKQRELERYGKRAY